jgi:hypothetical protein
VNPKIAGKWMFIPLKMVLIGIDPYPYVHKMAILVGKMMICQYLPVDLGLKPVFFPYIIPDLGGKK